MKAEICRRTNSNVRKFLTGLALVSTAGLFSGQAAAVFTPPIEFTGPDPVQITFTLEGCKLDNDDGTYSPPGSLLCADAAYTTGNLGKMWNELDLVPHRLTADATGAPSNATLPGNTPAQKYQVMVGGDNEIGTPYPIGYDFVTDPVLNTALSTTVAPSGDCHVDVIARNLTGDYGIGGANTQIVNVLEITQAIDSICVFDYVEELAITSSDISGSSNRSFIASGSGEKSVPIPSDIQPQTLSKSMSAVENATITWSLEKSANPTTFEFGNTCDNDTVPNSKDVLVTVTLKKKGSNPDKLVETSDITENNPSQRDVTFDCTDTVYGVQPADDNETAFSKDFVEVVGTGVNHTFVEHELPEGTRMLRDEVNCDLYVDSLLPPYDPVQVGTLTAEADLDDGAIGTGETVNSSVQVDDNEVITGDHYTFSATKSGGTMPGDFIGYTPGTSTTGPVLWSSDNDLSDNDTVVFTKTVVVERGYDTDGTLSDVATVNLTPTSALSATASTTFNTQPLIDLTIHKSLTFTVTGDTEWNFKVHEGTSCLADNDVVASPKVTVAGGSTSGQVTVDNLDPGTYLVCETPASHWTPQQSSQSAVLTLPSCSADVTFTNSPAQDFYAEVEVRKVTYPAGHEGGWTFDLYSDNADNDAQVTTDNDAFKRFNLDIHGNAGADPGNFSIVEQPQSGWDEDNDVRTWSKVGCDDSAQDGGPYPGCSFNVSYARDAGCVFQCTYTNIQRGTIIVEKQTVPDGSLQTFDFTGDAEDNDVGDNDQIVVNNLVPGTYTSTEAVPDGWDLTDITCDDNDSATKSSGNLGNATATFELDPGETVKCVFTNTERATAKVVKTVSGSPPTGSESFAFDVRYGASATSDGTVIATATCDASNWDNCTFSCSSLDPKCTNVGGEANLVPGDYQICETELPVNWTTSITGEPGFFQPYCPGTSCDNSTYCFPITLGPGDDDSFSVNNTPPPMGDARTIGYWKTHSCLAPGNQEDKLSYWLSQSFVTCDGTNGDVVGTEGDKGIVVGRNCYTTCEPLVYILDKRDDSPQHKKSASDPCFNAGSQYVAASLNNIAGAGCGALDGLLSDTQDDLYDAQFDGSKCNVKRSTLGDNLNTDAGLLDDYNNNEPGSACN